MKDYRFKCKDCNKTFSVTANTMLHNTKLPVRRWLFAFSIVTDAKKGVSAKQLERNLDISYPTAWKMAMKIRELMADVKPIKLDGVLEMDETYVGGKPRERAIMNLTEVEKKAYNTKLSKLDKNYLISEGSYKKPKGVKNPKRGRGTDKTPVVGIVKRDGSVVAQVMNKLTYNELKAMVEKNVNRSKSVLITDDFSSYNRFDKIIEHIKIDHQKVFSYKGINTNTIESFWAIIKRGIAGTYHQFSEKHLPKYITEFIFKYNNRLDDEIMFEILVKISVKPNTL